MFLALGPSADRRPGLPRHPMTHAKAVTIAAHPRLPDHHPVMLPSFSPQLAIPVILLLFPEYFDFFHTLQGTLFVSFRHPSATHVFRLPTPSWCLRRQRSRR